MTTMTRRTAPRGAPPVMTVGWDHDHQRADPSAGQEFHPEAEGRGVMVKS